VGIVSYNTADLLRSCLEALPAALGEISAEVVVVDNASSDRSAEVAARFEPAGVRVVRGTENVGYARAMNQALAATEAEVLLALNPDTKCRPGSLARLVEVLRAEPAVGLAVPRLLNPDGTLQHSVHRFPSVAVALAMGLMPMRLRAARRAWLGRRFWLEGFAPHDRRTAVDWAIGAVHAIRRAALRDPDHAFTERWFMYVEDMELCWELRRQGWRVLLEPESEVVHVGSPPRTPAGREAKDIRELDATYDWYVRERGAAAARVFAAANLAGLSAKLAVLRARRAAAPGPEDRGYRFTQLRRMHAAKLKHVEAPLSLALNSSTHP
jgi:GT2 family glycosyltransferase